MVDFHNLGFYITIGSTSFFYDLIMDDISRDFSEYFNLCWSFSVICFSLLTFYFRLLWFAEEICETYYKNSKK